MIMETLRAFHASGLGAEELDDFVLQTVLNLHGGPSRDAGPNATGDPIGDDQMRLYQECIAVIDDFLDIQAMIVRTAPSAHVRRVCNRVLTHRPTRTMRTTCRTWSTTRTTTPWTAGREAQDDNVE